MEIFYGVNARIWANAVSCSHITFFVGCSLLPPNRKSTGIRTIRTTPTLRGAIPSSRTETHTPNPLLPLDLHYSIRNVHPGVSGAEAREQAKTLLERVLLPDPARQIQRYPHELSGGQRQRVMLAMALACAPKLLIADEPTTALDVTIQAQILDLLREMQREIGAALLFITHDMAVVDEIADRVVVMKAGEKVEDGSVDAIFAAPRHPYSQALLAAVPRLGALTGTDCPRRFAAAKQNPPRRAKGQEKLLIEVRDLVTRFPVRTGLLRRKTAEVHAVDMASFDIAAGQTLALVGESGSGKSTLARSVLRLVEPVSGTVSLDGTELTTLKPGELRKMRTKMQIIFQDPYASMNPRRRIFDQIADPVRIHDSPDEAELRARLENLIREVDLPADSLERFPHEFSGGQRQRLCIARAMSLAPALLLLRMSRSRPSTSRSRRRSSTSCSICKSGRGSLTSSFRMTWRSSSALPTASP